MYTLCVASYALSTYRQGAYYMEEAITVVIAGILLFLVVVGGVLIDSHMKLSHERYLACIQSDSPELCLPAQTP